MTFAPENALEEALQRSVSDPAARPQFYRLLMQSPLIVPGRVEGHTDSGAVLQALDAHHFELLQVKAKDRLYHPVFTALSRLTVFAKGGEQDYFTVIGRSLFDNTRGAAFLLNAGSKVGKELLPDEIASLLDAKPRRQQADGQNSIAISEPDPYPGKLTGALGIFFLNRSQVVSAHLVQAVLTDKEPPHLLIGLVAHGNPRRIIAEIGEVAAALHTPNSVDVMVLDPARPRSDLQARLLATPPFYARPITPQSQGKH